MSITAFFDLDYTLINTSSGIVYFKEIIKQRRAPIWFLGYVGLAYHLQSLDFGQAHCKLIKRVGRQGHINTEKFFKDWVTQRVFPYLTRAGKEKIAWHQRQGHRVVIISASIGEIVRPVAEHLGLAQDFLCTNLEVVDGHYTGRLAGPLCYGPGKVYWAKKWAAENGVSFPETVGYFYTDSSSDLPLLELAKYPVAVNPSRKLAKIARARGWQIEKFY